MRTMERRNPPRDKSQGVQDPRLYVLFHHASEREAQLTLTLSLSLGAPLAGLTDYEVRDLNDEINKLLREKRAWENQIVALGGANYRRNVAMIDDDGKEVPGTKGYKYEWRNFS